MSTIWTQLPFENIYLLRSFPVLEEVVNADLYWRL